ncbi:hypothetical protein WKT22_01815 [Candidatus Lokiarchaeum ossiferum]
MDIMILAEEVLLLALDDESGKLSGTSAPYINYAIAGSLLTDLALMGRIAFETMKKDKIVVQIIDDQLTQDPLLDKALIIIQEYSKERKIDKIVHLLIRKYSEFREGLFSRLVEQGILERVEKLRLKIFKYVRHPVINPSPKDAILVDIQDFIVDDKHPSDRIVGLLAIIGATEMIGTVFAKEYRKRAKKKISAIIDSDLIGSHLKSIIQSIHAAVAIAVITSSTAATSSIH